jgi:hypothetical protein
MTTTLYYILGPDGEPVPEPSGRRWAKWYETHPQERIVAQSTHDPLFVSTIFLGIDHSFSLGGPPVLWETMVFVRGVPDTHPVEEHRMWRYLGRVAALAHHDQIMAALREGCGLAELPDPAGGFGW